MFSAIVCFDRPFFSGTALVSAQWTETDCRTGTPDTGFSDPRLAGCCTLLQIDHRQDNGHPLEPRDSACIRIAVYSSGFSAVSSQIPHEFLWFLA
jgi:hypothetical protein